MDDDSLIVCVVSYLSEKQPATEQGDLEGLDIDVGMKAPPGVCSYTVRHKRGKQPVKVAEEKDGPALVSSAVHKGRVRVALTICHKRAAQSEGPS